jgi:hypothetical protein
MRCCQLLLIFFAFAANGQTFGPNSPTTAVNSTSIGTNAWTTPSNVLTSNDAYATNGTKGITNYIAATNFTFSIPVTTSINGIQLDVEKTSFSPTVVTLLNNWSAGLTKTVSAGSNRILLFIASMENGNSARDITALTYGGQAMTSIVEGSVGAVGGFCAKMEFWVLLESGIASATSTAFVPTFAAATLVENVEYYSSAVFSGVDQVLPYTSTQISATTSTVSAYTTTTSLATTGGGIAVSAIHCGNNTTPNTTPGGTNTYSVGAGLTEIVDTYTGCTCSASLTGLCTNISQMTVATSGTLTPTYTFAGTPNRQIVIFVNLACVREIDYSVRLLKAGVLTGSDLAYTTTPWNTVDTYTSYGSSSNLWGTTWTVADINASNFGAAFSASVSNGTARVDHMRITVTGTSLLPIELVDFYGEALEDANRLQWQTASERNNKQFEIERSDGISDFKTIGVLKGKVNSGVFTSYTFVDENPGKGQVYYRLKQVDEDGSYSYFKTIVITSNAGTNEVVVYPNPSYDGRFTVASSQAVGENIYIYSSDFRLIKVLYNEPRQLDLTLTELTDNIYYLVFEVNGKQKIKKIEKVCR